ncbi:PAAR domain-containing protein [Paraburkholderia sp. Tr-20389]|uniref:PAAR domain-containing protein n=1 Tax=Paraburkholderia sp. Tr-20389 TaxID=2703903 RepID=UPI001980C385|nr:PAAR domain-containing protein [Paraburkholderia sp. Tr-20389]MBN3754685.1 PAAR domain-containing protein [Paraburkholderia sp. Tr-20389]
MAIYYAIVDGDPLTSGPNSRVYAPSTSCFIDGDDGRQRSMAYIGDKAYCEKCKSTGIIIGGARVDNNQRMIDLEDGRRQAVGGDYVLCKCPERPQVIARYGRNWMIEDGGSARAATGAKTTSAGNVSPAAHDEQVKAIGRGASKGYPYYIETVNGRIESGRLDLSGVLPRIYTDNADTYTIHWGDDALSHEGWINAQ